MAGNKPEKADETILTLLETTTATHYRTDFGSITFGGDDIAVAPSVYSRLAAEHSAHGAPHPSPGSMTDFRPVIDRLNSEICR